MRKLFSLYCFKNNFFMISAGKPIIDLEIQLVDHCNLNCKGCSHFSNISKEFYINTETLEKDLTELSKKLQIRKLGFIGGEPLLHPELKKCLEIAKNILNDVDISICTNGLLLFKLPDDVLDYISDNKIKFVFSKYPANNSCFTKLLDFTEEKNIDANVIYTRNHFRKYINLKGDSNIKETYKKCIMKQCYILREGKIYHCPFAIYVHNFNREYNQNIKVDEGIDIYKSSTKSIVNYIMNPIETCRFCTFTDTDNVNMKWETGKADMNDWIIN